MFENDTYKENIKSFKKVLSSEADKLLSNENLATVYIGRETCPFLLTINPGTVTTLYFDLNEFILSSEKSALST